MADTKIDTANIHSNFSRNRVEMYYSPDISLKFIVQILNSTVNSILFRSVRFGVTYTVFKQCRPRTIHCARYFSLYTEYAVSVTVSSKSVIHVFDLCR